MTETEPTVDLGAVRWSTENRNDGWHLVAIEDQPDGYGEVAYDLRVERGTDHRGNDLSAAVAEALAQQVDGWIFEIDRTERDAYARGRNAGRDVQDARWRVANAERDRERRYDLGRALGFPLNADPLDEDIPTWEQIMQEIKAQQEGRA